MQLKSDFQGAEGRYKIEQEHEYVLSWLLMHAVSGLRYAHKFYDDSVSSTEKHAGGLEFPEDDLPDYRDFAYFSFVIGMTCQISDVNVTSRRCGGWSCYTGYCRSASTP